MSKSFPEWWKHGQKVRTASDGILTLNIAEDAEYWLTNDAGKEVSVFSADILGPASTPEACRMTTDITELALLVSKAKASVFTLEYISQFEPADIDSDDVDLRFEVDGRDTGTNVSIVDECGQAARVIGALVEALEKAQAKIALVAGGIEAAAKLHGRIAELEPISAAAEKLVRCKGRYHSEQNYRALAALFGATTPDLPPLDEESRTVTVKMPKPHAHLIWIQAGHAPDDYWDDVAVSHSEKDRCCDGSERYPVYARWEIEEMLTAAGIKVEAE
ncbi:TPA: hypothetical protein ACX3MK_001918 [Raoultella ornithinolytica]